MLIYLLIYYWIWFCWRSKLVGVNNSFSPITLTKLIWHEVMSFFKKIDVMKPCHIHNYSNFTNNTKHVLFLFLSLPFYTEVVREKFFSLAFVSLLSPSLLSLFFFIENSRALPEQCPYKPCLLSKVCHYVIIWIHFHFLWISFLFSNKTHKKNLLWYIYYQSH